MNNIEQLSKRLWTIHKRHLRRKAAYRKALEADQREAYRIGQERHKALLQMLVGVEDEIQMAVRTGSPEDDQYGTVKRVMRSRCLVEFVGFGVRTIERPAERRKVVVFQNAVLDAIENGVLKRPILQ